MSRTRKVGSPIGYSGSAAAGLTGFVSVWATTAEDETITIPCQNVGTFNAIIDWGDGTVETITTYNGFSHEYADIDDYTISITGTFPNIYLNSGASAPKLKRVTNLGTVGWTRLNNAFYGCTNLTQFTAGSTDTSAVTSMAIMLFNCSNLTSLDVSSFDTSNVTSMALMVGNCTGLTSLDLASFDTSSVTNMAQMFFGCSSVTSLVGVEDWAITGLDGTADLTQFLTVGSMTTAQYDNLLVKWEAQASGIPAMTPSFGTSTYTGGSAAATARQDLIDIDGWSISDGGIAP